jgi:hypothetical protein
MTPAGNSTDQLPNWLAASVALSCDPGLLLKGKN